MIALDSEGTRLSLLGYFCHYNLWLTQCYYLTIYIHLSKLVAAFFGFMT